MKPRQKSAPETGEDFDVWLWVQALQRRRYGRVPRLPYSDADRRDADLMYFMTRFGVRHWSTWAPRSRPPFWMATAHTFLMIDPEWPAGHHVIDLT